MSVPRSPSLLLAALLLAATIGACADRPRPSVLIITVDTLRADFLGAYGDTTGLTPNIDALARSATLFENAAAPMPMTRPSHFSMLTSKYPREHGVLNNSTALPESAVSVAEILGASGYHTAAVVGVQLLSLKSGTKQGFQLYSLPRAKRDRRAELVVHRALKWLDNLTDSEPFFLWVHLFDAHMPYEPPAAYRSPAAGDLTAMTGDLLREISAAHNGDIPATIVQQSKALYRGEIAYADHWIGELLRGVDRRFDLDDILVVLTADHGECFDNGVYFDHAHCLSQSALRIPLIVRYPDEFGPGERVMTQVSIVDVTPTILEIVDLEPGIELSGRPLQQSPEVEDRAVLLQHPYYEPEQVERYPSFDLPFTTVAGKPVLERRPDLQLVGLVSGEWKYLRSAETEILSRTTGKGSEERHLEDEYPEIRRQLADQLQKLLAQHPSRQRSPVRTDEDLRETLKALGYIN